MGLIKAFLMSLSMFSVLPVPRRVWQDQYLPLMLPNLPVVGALIGLIWLALAWLLTQTACPPLIQAALIMLTPLALSGFLHLDGLMDTADAIGSRRELAERQRILKDSAVGAFAAIALASVFLLQFCAIASLIAVPGKLWLLCLIPVISRSVTGLALLNLKPIAATGFAATFKAGTKPRHSVWLAICLAASIIAAACWLGVLACCVLAIETLVAVLLTWYVYRNLAGLSGDLCGAIISLGELAGLLALAIL